MRKIALTTVLLLSVCLLFAQTDAKNYADQISLEIMKGHIETLASENMAGRNTGEPGQKMAAEYIADYFEKAGLVAPNISNKNPYYQPFSLYKFDIGYTLLWGDTSKIGTGLFFASKHVVDSINREIVFVGNAKESDLESVNSSDKILFYLAEDFEESIEKAKELAKEGQVNYFIASYPSKTKRRYTLTNSLELSSMSHIYFSYYYNAPQLSPKEVFVDKAIKNEVIPNLMIDSDKDIRLLLLPDYQMGRLYGLAYDDLKNKTEKAYSQNISMSNILPSKSIKMKIKYTPEIDSVITENVAGYIKGETDETMIICGHYDHVGEYYKGGICYGADDNASGTGAVLECAKQFGDAYKDGWRPKKNILFLAFSAEELGLYGSDFYVKNPMFPIENTSLCLNLDMIGRDRNDKEKFNNTVFVLGWKDGKKYRSLSKKLNKGYTNLKIDKTPGLIERLTWKSSSDHYLFLIKDIPIYTFFTGLHDDYHTPGDTPDKINYDKYKRITQLIFLSAWEIAEE